MRYAATVLALTAMALPIIAADFQISIGSGKRLFLYTS